MRMYTLRFSIAFMLTIVLTGITGVAAADHAAGKIGMILASERVTPQGGICTVLGAEDPEFAMAMVKATKLLVHVIDPDPVRIAALQALAREANLPIQRLLVEQGDINALPYLDNMIDMIIAPDLSKAALESINLKELKRVARPGALVAINAMPLDQERRDIDAIMSMFGAVFMDTRVSVPDDPALGIWGISKKSEPAGQDDWTHWEHGPDNNPVSTDQGIKAPYMTQWLAEPYYIAMPAITLAAGGRTFLATGHIAHHEREEPWLNTLYARNGYNGAGLWQMRLPENYLVHRSAFIATDDLFYMIDLTGQGCIMLDPETGMKRDFISAPAPGIWKWMAMKGDTLLALISDTADPPQTTVVRSQMPAWSWAELSTGYYDDRVPWGFGETLVAIDLKTKEAKWTHREDAPIDSRAMTVGDDGRVYFYAPDIRLGCLEIESGKLVWTNEDQALRDIIEQKGIGLSSTPGFRTSCYSLYTPESIVFSAQTRQNVVGVSKHDGSLLWQHGKTTSNPNAIYADGFVLAGIGDEGSTMMLNPRTGEVAKDLDFNKRSCARLTGTPDSFFCRANPEGIVRYNRQTGEITKDGAMRPACNDGVLGANGLIYVGPWACDCNLSVIGAVGMRSAETIDAKATLGDRLTPGDGDPAKVASLSVDALDWPTYRGGFDRAASSLAGVSNRLFPVWGWQPPLAMPTAGAVAVGDFVFTAGKDGNVRAINMNTGMELWAYQTAGAILQPPTIWEGRAYVGSGDGYVYALEATTGRLLWKFRAAPVERRMLAYGNLTATWPVNTGVLIHEGTAYFGAGIIDYDGTYLYAVDAVTGALKWANDSTGHLDAALRKGVSAQGNLTVMDGAVWLAGGNIVHASPYDLETGEYLGEKDTGIGTPRTNRGEEIGVFQNEYLLTGGRLRYSAPDNIVSPGKFTFDMGEQEIHLCASRVVPAWDEELLVLAAGRTAAPAAYASPRVAEKLAGGNELSGFGKILWTADSLAGMEVLALALARDAVVTVVEANQFRSLVPRYKLVLLNRENGRQIAEHVLPGEIRLNGLAIDRQGRILISMADGSMQCFGGNTAFESYVSDVIASVKNNSISTEKGAVQLRKGLQKIHDTAGRKKIMAALESMGVDPLEEATANGAVTQWWVIGPVPWDPANVPTDAVLVNEPDIDLKGTYEFKNVSYGWEEFISVDPYGKIDLNAIYGPHAFVAAYAYAEIDLPESGSYEMRVGSNDGFKGWFNGQEVGRFDGGRSYSPDRDIYTVQGKQGKNTVLLKITQHGGAWAYSVRLVKK